MIRADTDRYANGGNTDRRRCRRYWPHSQMRMCQWRLTCKINLLERLEARKGIYLEDDAYMDIFDKDETSGEPVPGGTELSLLKRRFTPTSPMQCHRFDIESLARVHG